MPHQFLCPVDSKMGRSDPSLQRLLLNSLQWGSTVDPVGCVNLVAPLSNPAAIPSPAGFGDSALLLSGSAEAQNAKADFRISGWNPLPGNPRMVGLWVYIPPDANVGQVGLEIESNAGPLWTDFLPASWTGWKWIEADLNTSDFVQSPSQTHEDATGPPIVKSVHIAWMAKGAGPTSIIVNDLSAVTDLSTESPNHLLTASLVGATIAKPETPFGTLLSLTNFAPANAAATIDFSVQHDSTLYDRPPPDPVYGCDRALGAKSWTVADGQIIEHGSLTDGKKWTFAETPQIGHHWTEAYQYIDLGTVRKITRMTWDSGDAGRLINVDISGSEDGNAYFPIPSLQNFDLLRKWGVNVFPLTGPFDARFVRFRYYKDGPKLNGIRMPEEISIYDGVNNHDLEIPRVGRVVTTGQLTSTVPTTWRCDHRTELSGKFISRGISGDRKCSFRR